jgi:hypothetical protein
MPVITFNDWREENKRRKYPFSDNVPAASDELAIPDDLFFDGRLYPIDGTQDMYLSRITKTASSLEFAIRSSGTEELAVATFALNDIPDNDELAFFDTYGRAAGLLLAEEASLRAFSGMDIGEYTFFLSQTQFAAAVAVPQPAVGVRGILLESGDMLTGEVWLVGEDGIVLRRDDDAIRIDIIGDPFASRKLCEDSLTNEEDVTTLVPYCPIKTLNGIEPDDNGNFKLIPGTNASLSTILRITPGSQDSGAVTKHLNGEGTLQFATLMIELIGQRRFRGV